MARYFNTEGSCKPDEHYMVRLDDRIAHIKKMLVDRKNILSSTGDGRTASPHPRTPKHFDI